MAGKCPVCGAPLEKESCSYCGYVSKKDPEPSFYAPPIPQQPVQPQIIINNQQVNSIGIVRGVSRKSKMTALLLCIFLGYFGAHYFYVGKGGKGLLYLFTVGLFGIGWIVDIFRIASGSFRDEFDLPLIN